MNSLAPVQLAESWDNPGLQIGNPSAPVQRVMVALDITKENIEYAEKNHIQMIIAHHPFLFKPMKRIDMSNFKGNLVSRIIKNDILIFAAHTNLDTVFEGVNDALAGKLGLIRCEGLVPVRGNPLMMLTADFGALVPEGLLNMLKADFSGTAAFCLFGNGEIRIKAKQSVLGAVLSAVKKFQPKHYEILQCVDHEENDFMGRIGELPEPMQGTEVLQFIKERLGIPVLKYCGDASRVVRKVALLGGAGAEFSSLARSRGADLYVTGDVKYHEAQDAAAEGLLLADGGHYYTERVIIPYLADIIRKTAERNQWNLTVYEDQVSTDIFRYI